MSPCQDIVHRDWWDCQILDPVYADGTVTQGVDLRSGLCQEEHFDVLAVIEWIALLTLQVWYA